MKLFQYAMFALVLSVFTVALAIAEDCPKYKMDAVGSGWAVDKSEAKAEAAALEMAKEDGVTSCLDLLQARCEFAGCKLPTNVKAPTAKAYTDFCYQDSNDKDWTCVAGSDSKCSAQCE